MGVSAPVASDIVKDLVEAGILVEKGGHPASYHCEEILDILTQAREKEIDPEMLL